MEKWTTKEYTNALRIARKNHQFNFTLSEFKKNPTPARKSIIRRVQNQTKNLQMAGAEIIKPRRRPRESDYHYKKRIRTIKKKYNQSGSVLQGITARIPKGRKARWKGDSFFIANPATGYKEKLFPANLQALAVMPGEEIGSLKEQARKEGFTHANLMYETGHRSNLRYRLEPTEDDAMEERAERESQKYKEIEPARIAGIVAWRIDK